MGADHDCSCAGDLLKARKFLSRFGKGLQPGRDFELFTEEGTISILNIIMENLQLRSIGRQTTSGVCIPARVIQDLHGGSIVHMPHQIDMRKTYIGVGKLWRA